MRSIGALAIDMSTKMIDALKGGVNNEATAAGQGDPPFKAVGPYSLGAHSKFPDGLHSTDLGGRFYGESIYSAIYKKE